MKLISIVLASALVPATALASPSSKNTHNNRDTSATTTQSVEVEAFEWSSGQGHLGLMLEGLTPQLRAYFGAPNDAGLLVAQVAPNSPAQKAGVQVGDVITQVNRQRVQSADDILSATRSASTNGTTSSSSTTSGNTSGNSASMANAVQIHVIRNHAALDLQATLGATKTPGA